MEGLPGLKDETLPLREKSFQVLLSDIAILMMNVWIGSLTEGVGFEDANQTLEELIHRKLNKKVWINARELESALWSANLLNEREEFFHPYGKTFEAFLDGVLMSEKRFNRRYNFIEPAAGLERAPTDEELANSRANDMLKKYW